MKEKKQNKLFIKNMVCDRCIFTVESILNNLGIASGKVLLGEAEIASELSEAKRQELTNALKKVGFELIETRVKKIIEDIKKYVLSYIGDQSGDKRLKLSSFITSRLNYDYSYLSDLFSSIEGITIEQFFIVQRIEKVKELMVYEELSLTEISYQTGFSSVHHLSAQFKKVTGLTPSHFKKIGSEKRRSIDSI
jgi:AraC family transcriptional regulator